MRANAKLLLFQRNKEIAYDQRSAIGCYLVGGGARSANSKYDSNDKAQKETQSCVSKVFNASVAS